MLHFQGSLVQNSITVNCTSKPTVTLQFYYCMNYIFVRRQSITRMPAITKGSRVRCEDVYSVLARPIVIRVHKQFDRPALCNV